MPFLYNQTDCINSYMKQRNCIWTDGVASQYRSSGSNCQNWNWTCEETTDWCINYQSYVLAFSYYAFVDNLMHYRILPTLGIISPVLFCITIFRSAFSDNSAFIYLRVLAFAEFTRITCFIVYMLLPNPTIPSPNALQSAYAVFYWAIIYISNTIFQLFIPIASLCLAFERALSMCAPTYFNRINSKMMAIILCFFSYLFSAILGSGTQLGTLMTFLYGTQWMSIDAFKFIPSLETFLLSFITIYCPTCVIALIVLLSILILYAMKKRMRKIKLMVSSENAKIEIDKMKKVCKFQLLEAFVVSLDFLIEIFITKMFWPFVFSLTDPDCSYPGQLHNIRLLFVALPFRFFSIIFLIRFSYFLFFVYVLLNNLFRKEFLGLIKDIFNKLRDFIHKLNGTTIVQVISVQN